MSLKWVTIDNNNKYTTLDFFMATEYFDVLIIGAGLSGIGSAVHLKKKLPNKSFAIIEGRDAIGGT